MEVGIVISGRAKNGPIPRRLLSRRRAIGVAALAAGLTAAEPRVAAQEATPTSGVPADFKVVLHAAQADHWVYVQSNIENVMRNWPSARVRVVVDGNAVSSLLCESHLTTALARAIDGGLELYICPNALAEHGIPADAISLRANLELGGIIALVAAHNDGYVYVKP
jgi:intracellular sulfur oxidation DsrE/DsrF family protein